MVSPMLMPVPATGAVPDRLQRVAAQVRAHQAAATGPPPIAVLGWLFRPLAALGGYRWYMNHQHRFHTLVTHVRGPAELVTFAGSPVTCAIPAGVGPGGNIPVYFEVLSYAGTLTLTVTVDPGRFPGRCPVRRIRPDHPPSRGRALSTALQRCESVRTHRALP
jgi:diacylglycerol O-acyltransferase / wax synthase